MQLMNKRVGDESADAVLVGRECERYVEEDATGGLEYDKTYHGAHTNGESLPSLHTAW